MLEVNFYHESDVKEEQLDFAVIVSKFKGKWVLCKHKQRSTWEVPGGRKEQGETILNTAKRELFEETGAIQFDLIPICVYAVKKDTESFGMLYYAEIFEFGELPASEIETIHQFDDIPQDLTYPFIQPKLMKKIEEFKLNV